MKTAKVTDERINLTTEVLNGIKIIKMYCWENPFKKMIDKFRKYYKIIILGFLK